MHDNHSGRNNLFCTFQSMDWEFEILPALSEMYRQPSKCCDVKDRNRQKDEMLNGLGEYPEDNQRSNKSRKLKANVKLSSTAPYSMPLDHDCCFLHRGKKTTLVPGLLDYYPQYCYLIWYAVSDLTISLAVRLPERSLNKNYRAWRVTEFIRWVDHWIRKRAQLPVSCKPNLFHLILRLIMSRRRWPLRLSAMLNH